MNHLDLFSGIGGFSLGLKLAGVEPEWIGYSDIDKYANQVFKRRFPNAKELGSIIDIRPDELPKIDLVTFGFPCQDLSIAGKRGGLKANRSSLFFKAIEIIRHKKPKYFVFENVKGLFSSNGGQDFLLILRAISDIGYDGQWQLLNTRWFLPQNRERVYFVGHIRGESRPKVFPIGEASKNSEKELSRMTPIVKVHTTQPRSADRPSLKYSSGGSGPLSKEDGTTYCLDTGNSQAVEVKKTKIRRLTPTETCRLQGFPDDWNDCCSDTQRYKQTGNAVSVPVVQAIMERLYER